MDSFSNCQESNFKSRELVDENRWDENRESRMSSTVINPEGGDRISEGYGFGVDDGVKGGMAKRKKNVVRQ